MTTSLSAATGNFTSAHSVHRVASEVEDRFQRDLHFVSDVLAGVDEEDKMNITRFAIFLEDWVQVNGVGEKYSIFHLLEKFGIYNLTTLNKEGTCLQALWVIFLRIMRKNLGNDALFKYKSMTDFLVSYNGDFDKLDASEQVKLFHTANWMTILFKMVPAKKNKGLAVHVIPKLVEGFSVKYITGSGQTKATADRVHIFEHEGSVKPFQRGKWKNNEDMRQQYRGGGSPAEQPTARKGRKEPVMMEAPAYVPNKRLRAPPAAAASAGVMEGLPAMVPLSQYGRDRSLDSVDFAECLKLLRSNSQTLSRPSAGEAGDTVPTYERNRSIDSVDFGECLKLLRTTSYSKPPDLSRDWSNSSMGFLTDSLLQPLPDGAGGFSFMNSGLGNSSDSNDGLSLLNEAAHVSSVLAMNGGDLGVFGVDGGKEPTFSLSKYNQLASAPFAPTTQRTAGVATLWRSPSSINVSSASSSSEALVTHSPQLISASSALRQPGHNPI